MNKTMGCFITVFVLRLWMPFTVFGFNADEYKENFSPETRPHFSAVWLEPASLSNRKSPLSSEMVDKMFSRYKQYGVKKIVVAYSHYNNAFLFAPQNIYSFTAYTVDKNKQLKSEIVRSWDSAHRSPTLSDKFITNAIMESAKKHGMTVYLGLSQTGDTDYLVDMENLVGGKIHSMTITPNSVPYLTRYLQNINTSIAIAHDLYKQFSQYGATLEGWYLPQETSCIDVGLDYYYRPVAQSLKKSYPDKKIMVSPAANPRVCFAQEGPLGYETYMQLVGETVMVGQKKLKLIDVYNYQDAVGAGTYVKDGYVGNYYNDYYRTERMLQLYPEFDRLKLIHAQVGNEFWINTEVWEMDGSAGYASPYTGKFAADNPDTFDRVYTQLANYAGRFGCTLMMNEGFASFNYNSIDQTLFPSIRDEKAQKTSLEFTLRYESYLRNTHIYYLVDYMDWNPPKINGFSSEKVLGGTKLKLSAEDNKGVTKVWFFRNGTFMYEDTTAPFEYISNDSDVSKYSAWAFDLTGAHVSTMSSPQTSFRFGNPKYGGTINTVDGSRAYPVPWRPEDGTVGITFDQIPAETSVRIYTIDGRAVKTLTAKPTEDVVWDLTNDEDNPVASGVYLAVLEKDGTRKRLKVVVQK